MAAGRRLGLIIPVGGNKAPPRRQTQVAVEGIFQGTNWLQFVKRKKGRVGPDLASQLCENNESCSVGGGHRRTRDWQQLRPRS